MIEIVTPWLLQRGKIGIVEKGVTDICKIVDFDYMGSAEYEFGALGRSVKRIYQNIDNYVWVDVRLTDRKCIPHIISIFINSDCLKIIIVSDLINNLYTNKYRLKEPSYFKESIDKTSKYHKRNFWIDEENDYIITFGEYNKNMINIGIKDLIEYFKHQNEEG